MSQRWDHEADVVAVGFGAAGAAVAVETTDLGGTCVVVEKQEEWAHAPSTRMSGGTIMGVNDVAAASAYLDACAGGMVPAGVSQAWANEAHRLLDWLRKLAPDAVWSHVGHGEYPDVDGVDAVDAYRAGPAVDRLDFRGRPGERLYEILRRSVAQREVAVLWGESGARLLRDVAGTVAGVRTSSGKTIRARRGVVLTCGGYEFDEGLKREYLRAYPMQFYGSEANTGDGVRMAQAVGADLWHMGQMTGRAVGSFPGDDGNRLGFILRLSPPGYVIVDRQGRRFADEHDQALLTHTFYYELLKYDGRLGIHPRIPCYWIFDERRRRAGPLTVPEMGLVGVGKYEWSADNAREIDNGWIAMSTSIAEVARLAGIEDPAATDMAVASYNAACVDGGKDEFGRPAESMVPLDQPPYYCVALYPGGANTGGGPRRDERGRIVDPWGAPIPGLFGAGELGQAIGLRYPADGANLSDALCFGRIAGRAAMES